MNRIHSVPNWINNTFKAGSKAANSLGHSTDKKATSSTGTGIERPDISNIEFVGPAVAIPRLKQALRSFPHNEFDLESVMKKTNLSDSIGEGACFGLSLAWLNDKIKNPDGKTIEKNGHLQTHEGLKAAFLLQQAYENKQTHTVNEDLNPPEAAARNAIGIVLTEKNLSFTTDSGGLDEEQIARTIKNPGHYIISLTGFNNAHCVSVVSPEKHTRNSSITVFDPNVGEFKMQADEAEYFFTALNARYRTVGWRYSGMDIFSVQSESQSSGSNPSGRQQNRRFAPTLQAHPLSNFRLDR
jgi:hypothetical protein